MPNPFSRRYARALPRLAIGLVVSLVLSTLVLLYAKSKSGDYLERMTDHFHHARATWTFFVVGLDAYTTPFGVTARRVPYPQTWLTWENHPVAYPPGMFLVFAVPAALGRYVSLSTLEFGKLVIAYLTLIMHAALWVMGLVMRRLRTTAWCAFLVFFWIFCVRVSLLGFYDGAWLLTSALAVFAMQRRRHARAVLWFVASALVSYRAACLAPLALVAFWNLHRSAARARTKALVTAASVAGGMVVVACFAALVRYGPKGDDGAHGMAWGYYAYVVLGVGLLVALLVTRGAGPLVGACVALSSLLSILHAGHNWHGLVCVAPLYALTLAERRPGWVQVLVAAWFVVFMQLAFGFPPLLWLEEMIRFVERGGATPA
ncbi:MAG: hypothetical protein JST00_39765 [Deltaproteobacteria bacterium]|nr:hypothetical protein [Deltaproteobacteria bacterium]